MPAQTRGVDPGIFYVIAKASALKLYPKLKTLPGLRRQIIKTGVIRGFLTGSSVITISMMYWISLFVLRGEAHRFVEILDEFWFLFISSLLAFFFGTIKLLITTQEEISQYEFKSQADGNLNPAKSFGVPSKREVARIPDMSSKPSLTLIEAKSAAPGTTQAGDRRHRISQETNSIIIRARRALQGPPPEDAFKTLRCALANNQRSRAVQIMKSFGILPNDIIDVRSNWTPLHYAAYFSEVNVIRLLLELGADPTQRDANLLSACDIAERSQREQEICDLLTSEYVASKMPSDGDTLLYAVR